MALVAEDGVGLRWKGDEWPKKPFDMYPEQCLRLLQTSTTCLARAEVSQQRGRGCGGEAGLELETRDLLDFR